MTHEWCIPSRHLRNLGGENTHGVSGERARPRCRHHGHHATGQHEPNGHMDHLGTHSVLAVQAALLGSVRLCLFGNLPTAACGFWCPSYAEAGAVANGTLELVLPSWQWRRRTWPPHPECDCRGRRY
jgi:hypothetical protein